MSKLTIKHKDVIMIKLTYYQELLKGALEINADPNVTNGNNKDVKAIDDAKYKGWVDALKWVLGFEEISEEDYLNIMFPEVNSNSKKEV